MLALNESAGFQCAQQRRLHGGLCTWSQGLLAWLSQRHPENLHLFQFHSSQFRNILEHNYLSEKPEDDKWGPWDTILRGHFVFCITPGSMRNTWLKVVSNIWSDRTYSTMCRTAPNGCLCTWGQTCRGQSSFQRDQWDLHLFCVFTGKKPFWYGVTYMSTVSHQVGSAVYFDYSDFL